MILICNQIFNLLKNKKMSIEINLFTSNLFVVQVQKVFKEPIVPEKKTPQTQARLSRISKSASNDSLDESQKPTKNSRKKKTANQEDITTQIIDQSQTGTQKSRAVSAKRNKKNDKGEGPLHIAVMKVKIMKN